MIRSCSCLVLAAAFQVIFGQVEQSGYEPKPPLHRFQRQTMSVPKHCLAPPRGVDLHKCCPMPSIFPEEDLKRCGVNKEKLERPKDDQTKGPWKCNVSKCVMRNANLLLANDSVDFEKFRPFVDKWASVNPNFTEAITAAKRLCTYDGAAAGPPVCEQDRVLICLTSNVLWHCDLQDLDGPSGCKLLKEHMDECRRFYYTQKEEEELLTRKRL